MIYFVDLNELPPNFLEPPASSTLAFMGLRSCLRSSRAGDGSCLTLAGDSACSARAGDIGVGEGARTTTREVKHGEATGQVP